MAEPGDGMALLEWTPPLDDRVRGYRVYTGTASGSYLQSKGFGIDVGNVTSYGLYNVPGGFTYYFAVTAYDAEGNESDYSNEASKAME